MPVLSKQVAALEAIKGRLEGQPTEAPPLPAIGVNPTTGGETLTARHSMGENANVNERPETVFARDNGMIADDVPRVDHFPISLMKRAHM